MVMAESAFSANINCYSKIYKKFKDNYVIDDWIL